MVQHHKYNFRLGCYMDYLKQLEPLVVNWHYFNRYRKLILTYRAQNIKKGSGVHAHHIAPECTHPEYAKDFENLVVLPTRAHFICHYILAKSTMHHKHISSFKMMRADCKSSKIYEALEVEWRAAISAANKGKTRT